MDDGIRACIEARTNMFGTYVDVPAEIAGEVEAFAAELETLGNEAADSTDFEAKFAAAGMQEKFNGLFAKCTPKAFEMTAEQKAASAAMARENLSARDVAMDIADMAATEIREEAISMKRKAMIESGTFDEYTRVSNKIDDIKRIGKLLKK